MDAQERFFDVASQDQLPPGNTLKVKMAHGDILLANVDGKVYAVDDMCTHEDSSLALGCLKGELISCTLHGSRFSVVTGQPMEEPATEALRCYPVRIKDGRIEVCPGDFQDT